MKIIWIVAGVVLLSSFSRVTGAEATNRAAIASIQAPAPKADKKARGLPFNGHVAAIDKTAKSVTMTGKKQRVFHITSETKINKDQKPSRFEALTVGDYVGGFAREAPDGKLELVTLNITPQSPPTKRNGSPEKTVK